MLELQLLPLKCYRAVNAWPVGLQGDSATDSRYAGPTVGSCIFCSCISRSASAPGAIFKLAKECNAGGNTSDHA